MSNEQSNPKEQMKNTTENTGETPFPDEIAHLKEINAKLEDALQKAEATVERLDRQYMESKRYMAQNRGELDPHEMFQNELSLRDIDSSGAFAVDMRERIAKLTDSPYFARIDFGATEKEAEPYYIGRFTFRHENELLIYDWRAPVASMFYDHEPGPASYTAPKGEIQGELTRKRQFKITGGTMEYALESGSHVQDEVLQKELSQTSSEKMKSIIATIQKEQNQVIRNESAVTMIIQGVAGSGKTSIALHRVAFLLYRFKDRLTAQNVTIISPNKVFGNFIAGVLPELGEEPIYEVSLADIAEVQLEGVIGFEAEKDPLGDYGAAWKERVRYKSTLAFARQLETFAKEMPGMVFVPADYSFGRFKIPAEKICERFYAYAKYPVKQRLRMVADDVHDRFSNENIMGDDLPQSRSILKALQNMLTVKNTLALYKLFYKHIKRDDLFKLADKKTLEWADVYPFLYLHAAFVGLSESDVIKHLVVDEMQDYTSVQYAVLNLLFKSPKTILGDFGQRIHPNHAHTLEDLRELYSGAAFVQLNKSYRSSYEIISFARQIKSTGTLEAIERYGEAPAVIDCSDEADELTYIQKAISTFRQGQYTSLGIIAKTNADAVWLYEQLHTENAEGKVHLLRSESTRFENGVSVSSVQMAKGLEFDEVIVPNVSRENYHTEHDRSLLYIACTRAMHSLRLLYTGAVSPLLPQGFTKSSM